MPAFRHGYAAGASLRRLGVCVAAALVVGMLPGSWASASTDGGAKAEDERIRVIDATLPVVDNGTAAVWPWPQGKRIFRLRGIPRSADTAENARLEAYDSATFVKVAERAVPSAGVGFFGPAEGTPTGQREDMAVDEGSGRLFVPYSARTTHYDRVASPLNLDVTPITRLARGQACVTVAASHPCFLGFYVLDAATLEPVRDPILLRNLSVDGTGLAPALRTLAFAPPRMDGDPGKLLLVVEDRSHSSGWAEGPPQPRTLQGLYYAVQIDPVSGAVDWTVRLDGCRSSREPVPTDERVKAQYRPYPATIFRSPSVVDPAVWVGCHGPSQQAVVVRVPLDERGFASPAPVRVGDPESVVEGAPGGQGPGGLVGPAPSPQVFGGPESAWEVIGDVVSERMLFRVLSSGAEVWWVFDGRRGAFIGTIGIGKFDPTKNQTSAGLDPTTGRLYVAYGETGRSTQLMLADARRTPVAQALVFTPPGLGKPANAGSGGGALSVLPADEDGPTRVFLPVQETMSVMGPYGSPENVVVRDFYVVEDRVPVGVDGVSVVGGSVDVDEVEGVTEAALDGAARGYGARLLLVGGVDAAARAGRADPVTAVREVWGSANLNGTRREVNSVLPGWEPVGPCSGGNREVLLGVVGPSGPAVVDGSGSRGGAAPVVVDQALRSDLEAPVSRCSPLQWESLWGKALFGRAPVSEASVPWLFGEGPAECVSAAEETADSVGDAVVGAFAAGVRCGGDAEEASGFSYARGTTLGDLSVAEALSSFRIYRDPGRGIVSRVESVARGVQIPGVLRIDSVRGVAESWANGRRQPVGEAEREAGYAPNCDRERTAGTCFTRHIFGVSTPAYKCGPCGDEQAFTTGLSRAFGSYGSARLRNPDPRLAAGAENGSIAAVQKPDHERFGDLALNDDLLQTVVPTLEIIRQAPPAQATNFRTPLRRGRQIVQLAGVEVSSSYAIQCLLVYDAAAGTCSAAPVQAGGIEVSLVDGGGQPLAGGAFEVRADSDDDGLLGLADALVANGACVTAEDGVGACRFDGLTPGRYLVTQTAAPDGYGKVAEPFVVDLAEGERRTVAFTNTSNVSTVALTVTDEAGGPLAGAVFAAFADPDGDGKIAADAAPAASCTTDAAGACAMRVAAGSYVLVQTAAPGGLAPIEPVAFTFASGGQTAAVQVVNYPPDIAAPVEAAAPVYTAPPPVTPPVETVTAYPPDTQTAVVDEAAPPAVSVPQAVGGTIVAVIRAPGDMLRLLGRDPLQAAAWTASLVLFALAALAVQRRTNLHRLAFAPAGVHPPTPGRPTRPTGPGGPGGPSGPGGPKGRDGSGGLARGPAGGRSQPPGRVGPRPGTAPDGGVPASRHAAATAVLDAPVVGGAAHDVAPGPAVRVVVATASPVLAALATQRVTDAARVELAAAVGSLSELRRCLAAHMPDVVVIDLALPTADAQDICAVLAELHPAERTVGLIPPARSLEAMITRGCEANLGGLLVTDGDIGNGNLGYAIRMVASGKVCHGPTVQAVLLRRMRHQPRPRGRRPVEGLTGRELQIARLAADGVSRSDIARALFVSPETVKSKLRIVRAKLGVTDPRSAEQLRLRLTDYGLLHDDANPEADTGRDGVAS